MMHDAKPAHLVAYVSGYGPDIAWLDVTATGGLAPVGSIASFAASPSWLAIDPSHTHLYAVSEATSQVGAYAIDQTTGALTFIDAVSSGGNGPAHATVDPLGHFVLVANYGDGAVAVLPIRADGGVAAPVQTVNAGANAHMVYVAGSHAYVPCLGSNYVAQYDFDEASGMLAPNAVPHAAVTGGPRHIAFGASAAYVIDELASTITVMSSSGPGQLTGGQTISTRAAGATGTNTGAEVWVHPSGMFVFASNRGDNNIATFAVQANGMLSLVGHTPCGGMTPRDFTIDPSGTYLYVANQNSNNVVPFRIEASGLLTAIGTPATATQPSFVGIIALPP